MKYTIILFFLFLFCDMNAQQNSSCNIESFYKANVSEIEYKKDLVHSRSNEDTGEILSVRTVVHILYMDTSNILSNDSIVSIIDKTNNFFCGVVDTALIDTTFRNLINDTGIRLCLASEDPMGNPSEGITITEVDMSFDINDPMEALKSDDLGGVSPWDTTRYLNIWLMPTISTLFTSNYGIPLEGFMPLDAFVEPANIPGVAVDLGAFNGANLASASTAEGILAHEVGHSLGLLHTFGVGASGVDICSVDDFVDDTPLCGTSFFCDEYIDNTCVEAQDDQIDMSSNCMNVACLIFFTPGQTTVMRNNLLSFPNILTSDCNGDITSTADQNPFNLATVFPNPNKGTFYLDLDDNSFDITSVKMRDLGGRELAINYSLSQDRITIDCIDIPSNGLYILTINDTYVDKVIIHNGN